MIHTERVQASAGFVLRLFASGMRCSGTSQKHRDLTIYISVTKVILYKATLAQRTFRNDLDRSCCFTEYEAAKLRALSLDSVDSVHHSTNRWPQLFMPAKNCYVITKSNGSDLVVGVKKCRENGCKMEGDSQGQRWIMRFLCEEGIKLSNINRHLHAICREKAPTHSTVFKWAQSS